MSAMESVKQVLLASGAGWVLWFLGALSMSSLALAMERWLYLRKRAGNLEALARMLDEQLRAGDFARARQLLGRARRSRRAWRTPGCGSPSAAPKRRRRRCTARPRSSAVGSSAGWRSWRPSATTRRSSVCSAPSSASSTPSRSWDTPRRPRRDAAGQVASQAVMASIAEALVATAVGILVALPAVAAYNYLQRRVTRCCRGRRCSRTWSLPTSPTEARTALGACAAGGAGGGG